MTSLSCPSACRRSNDLLTVFLLHNTAFFRLFPYLTSHLAPLNHKFFFVYFNLIQLSNCPLDEGAFILYFVAACILRGISITLFKLNEEKKYRFYNIDHSH